MITAEDLCKQRSDVADGDRGESKLCVSPPQKNLIKYSRVRAVNKKDAREIGVGGGRVGEFMAYLRECGGSALTLMTVIIEPLIGLSV